MLASGHRVHLHTAMAVATALAMAALAPESSLVAMALESSLVAIAVELAAQECSLEPSLLQVCAAAERALAENQVQEGLEKEGVQQVEWHLDHVLCFCPLLSS